MKRHQINPTACAAHASSSKTDSGPIFAMHAAGYSEDQIRAFIAHRDALRYSDNAQSVSPAEITEEQP